MYKTYHMGFYTKYTLQGRAVSGKSDGVWNWHHTALAAVYAFHILRSETDKPTVFLILGLYVHFTCFYLNEV